MRARWLFLAPLALGSCNTTATGYPFHSRAVYEAPHSGFRVEVLASGSVAAGADLSSSGSGSARFCPLSGSTAVALTLELKAGAGRVSVELAGTPPAKSTAPWSARDASATLATELGRAGYRHLDRSELEESARAIDGVMAGPKGTLLRGQTRALGVLSTTLSRAAPRAAPRPSRCGSF
jgi:hypothetical protein